MLIKTISAEAGAELKVGYLFDDENEPTVLFFNAVGMKVETLYQMAKRYFENGVNFITWEHRACPGDGSHDSDFVMNTQLRDAKNIADAFKLQSVNIFGWCTGASIAIKFIDEHSSLVRKAAFIDGAFLFDGVPGGDLGNAMFEMCTVINDNESSLDYFHEATQPNDQKLKMLGLERAKWLEELVIYPYMGPKARLRNYCKAIVQSCAFDPMDSLVRISCPCLVFGVKNDRMVDYVNAVRAYEAIKDCRLILTKEGGHYNFFLSPELQTLALSFVKNSNGGSFLPNKEDFACAK